MDAKIVPRDVADRLLTAARQHGLNVRNGALRRTASRMCLSVEHGDYNGTATFGVGLDRYIWLGYRPNDSQRVRILSLNFPDEQVVEFSLGNIPAPGTATTGWRRFPWGVAFILQRAGFDISRGLDAVLYGNIPGGGMSRSASLTLNLIHTYLEANDISGTDPMAIVAMAQAVENDYVGSPCGNLDPIMITFARQGMGTSYDPETHRVEHVPLGSAAIDFCFVSLDTGRMRAGLEQSTYTIRRAECAELVRLARSEFAIRQLADVQDAALYERIMRRFEDSHPELCRRLKYIFEAQRRLPALLDAWRAGDLVTVGRIFREDGWGLRDDYAISGPELETMCDLARTVPGVLGERMLGGGDCGAAGALVRTEAVDTLKSVIAREYPRRHPDFANQYAVHACQMVDGIVRTDWPW